MNRITRSGTTDEILTLLGARLQRLRLRQNRTVADVARAAGLSVMSVTRAEHGENTTMETVVRILRALDQVEALDNFLPAPTVSPLALAHFGGHERQRARKPRAPQDPPAKP
ncbi:MAG TPA: helix-turn-helix transcriptional regulator [Gemmatimonadaceae bacterium]|jgi:transcriptional regulator with XRE-family HTH domain